VVQRRAQSSGITLERAVVKMTFKDVEVKSENKGGKLWE
jgi:hypothetical protein